MVKDTQFVLRRGDDGEVKLISLRELREKDKDLKFNVVDGGLVIIED